MSMHASSGTVKLPTEDTIFNLERTWDQFVGQLNKQIRQKILRENKQRYNTEGNTYADLKGNNCHLVTINKNFCPNDNQSDGVTDVIKPDGVADDVKQDRVTNVILHEKTACNIHLNNKTNNAPVVRTTSDNTCDRKTNGTTLEMQKPFLKSFNQMRNEICKICSMSKEDGAKTNVCHTRVMYGCKMCTAMYESEKEINIHINTHKRILKRRCSLCKMAFTEGEHFIDHIKRHGIVLECEVCGQVFVSKKQFRSHSCEHQSDSGFDSTDSQVSQYQQYTGGMYTDSQVSQRQTDKGIFSNDSKAWHQNADSVFDCSGSHANTHHTDSKLDCSDSHASNRHTDSALDCSDSHSSKDGHESHYQTDSGHGSSEDDEKISIHTVSRQGILYTDDDSTIYPEPLSKHKDNDKPLAKHKKPNNVLYHCGILKHKENTLCLNQEYPCKTCGNVFISSAELQIHDATHRRQLTKNVVLNIPRQQIKQHIDWLTGSTDISGRVAQKGLATEDSNAVHDEDKEKIISASVHNEDASVINHNNEEEEKGVPKEYKHNTLKSKINMQQRKDQERVYLRHVSDKNKFKRNKTCHSNQHLWIREGAMTGSGNTCSNNSRRILGTNYINIKNESFNFEASESKDTLPTTFNNRVHRCRFCSRRFDNINRLLRHQYKHISPNVAKYTPKSTTEYDNYPGRTEDIKFGHHASGIFNEEFTKNKVDIRVKSDQKLKEKHSTIVGDNYVADVTLKRHSKPCKTVQCQTKLDVKLEKHDSKHALDQSYKCYFCDKSYRKKSKFYRHIESHEKIGNRCHICIESFKKWGVLCAHLRTHCDNFYPYKCSTCDKGFDQRKTFKEHHRRQSCRRGSQVNVHKDLDKECSQYDTELRDLPKSFNLRNTPWEEFQTVFWQPEIPLFDING